MELQERKKRNEKKEMRKKKKKENKIALLLGRKLNSLESTTSKR